MKLLNLANSVYNFNNNGIETEKSDTKTSYWGGKVSRQVVTGTQVTLLCEHVSTQDQGI